MSFKREGDDSAWLNIIKKRRVTELLSEDIPADEALLTKNGRLACLVCPHRPVVDNLSILATHRSGKKHAEYAVRFIEKKEELELLKTGGEHKWRVSDNSSRQVSATTPENANDSTHTPQLISYSCTYDSRSRRRGERPYERRKVIDTPASCSVGAVYQTSMGAMKQCGIGTGSQSIHTTSQCISKSGADRTSNSSPTYNYNKRVTDDSRTGNKHALIDGTSCTKRLKPDTSRPVIGLRLGDAGSRKGWRDEVEEVLCPDKHFSTSQYWRRKNKQFEEQTTASKLLQKPTASVTNTVIKSISRTSDNQQSKPVLPLPRRKSSTCGTNFSASESEMLGKTVNSKKKDSTAGVQLDVKLSVIGQDNVSQSVNGQDTLANESEQSERKNLYLQAISSGWKRDRSGTWIKDEEAEFDSDEEPPTVA